MGIRSNTHFLHGADGDAADIQHLSELSAACERASKHAAGRQILISRLRAVLATLESSETAVPSTPRHGLFENLAAEKSFDEYWSGYRAFISGEALTGWTDTPFAQGWLAAASSRRQADFGRSSETSS